MYSDYTTSLMFSYNLLEENHEKSEFRIDFNVCVWVCELQGKVKRCYGLVSFTREEGTENALDLEMRPYQIKK